jgi:hypothetical protein
MYSGTIIDDLIAVVARAEQRAPMPPVYIEPVVLAGGAWNWEQRAAQYEQARVGVA